MSGKRAGVKLTVHIALRKAKPNMFSSTSNIEDGGIDDTPSENQESADQRLMC